MFGEMRLSERTLVGCVPGGIEPVAHFAHTGSILISEQENVLCYSSSL